MPIHESRSAPPSAEANNQDVFVWSLFLLGGADRDVDVEDVYWKSFELAPARLGWRTRPELCDYKKTAKALQSVEAKTHVGLVHKVGMYTRRLTADGSAWVERYRSILEQTYSGDQPVAAAQGSDHSVWQRRARSSPEFLNWKSGNDFNLADLADLLECSPASSTRVWKGRIDELQRAANVTGDAELRQFADSAMQYLRTKLGEWW